MAMASDMHTCIHVYDRGSSTACMQVWEQHREGRKMHALFCHAMLRGWALDAGAKPDTSDSSTTAKYTARRAAAILNGTDEIP